MVHMIRSEAPILRPACGIAEPGRLTEAQRAVLNAIGEHDGSCCVVGGPASGKTSTLVAAVVNRVETGIPLSQMVVLTGSRSQAQQLRARIVAGVGASQRGLQITTVHGWCLQLLQRFSDPASGVPRLLSAPEQEYRVRELLSGRDQSSWPSEIRPALGTRGFARQIRAILARARQLGFDPDDLEAAGHRAERPEWVATAKFFAEYLDVLDAEGVIDYTELVFRARLVLSEPQNSARLSETASVIFCDEFAELDRGMINLLADAGRAGGQVIAFADPDTVISQFRGADQRAVTDFTERFSLPGATARLLQLDDHPGCDPQIATALDGVAARLPSRGLPHLQPTAAKVGPMRAAARAATGGVNLSTDAEDIPDSAMRRGDHDDRGNAEPRSKIDGAAQAGEAMARSSAVRVELVPDSSAQSEQIAEVLREAHVRHGVEWQRQVVICPPGEQAVTALARRLSAAGIPVQLSGDENALAEEAPVRQLLLVLEAAVSRAADGRLEQTRAAQVLRTSMGTLDAVGLRRLSRQLRKRAAQAHPDDLLPASGRLIADELCAAALVPDDQTDPSPELAALITMRTLLNGLAEMINEGVDLSGLLWHAWSATSWPRTLQNEALRASENSARAHRDLDAVVALFDLAARQPEWKGIAGVRSLIAEVEAQQIAADTARESDPRRDSVAVTTPYRAKGYQWDLVILAGAQEGEWPRISNPEGLLRADLLGPEGFQPPEGPADRIAAERRSFLLAASRARQNLVAVAIDDPGGDTDRPSRFLAELGVRPMHREPEAMPSSLEGLVARLRRVSSDTSAGPGIRQAAARELAWLAGQKDGSGRALAAGADPADWWGLRMPSDPHRQIAVPGKPIRLTGSAVETILACPRRWFLGSRANGRPPKDIRAVFGTLVHQLIAEAAENGTPAADSADRLAEVWPQLPYGAGWYAKAELDEAVKTLQRYDLWASSGDHRRLLGVEIPFRLDLVLDGRDVVVTGVLDRLEADESNRLRVVDFKTAKRPPSEEQVREMDQLGIYQLAVREGAFDDQTGGLRELADAEVVYLRKDKSGQPTVLSQPALDSSAAATDSGTGTWVHEHLSRAAEIIATEDFYANINPNCRTCEFRLGCPAQTTEEDQW